MSTALTTIDPALLERVVVDGDLERLNPVQRLEWYRQRCEAAGLDPRTQPFSYLRLQGKLVLYANKSASDSLIANRKLTVQIVDRRPDGDLYEVQARVTRADGTAVDNVGIVSCQGKRGDDLCNARLKAVTKAIRRAVLSACGLGMLDDTEVDTIRDARRVTLEEAHAALPARTYREGDPAAEQVPDFAPPPQPKTWRERVAAISTIDQADDMAVRIDAAQEEQRLTAAQAGELRELLAKMRESIAAIEAGA